MRAPRPESLRVYAKDGKEFDVEIKPGVAWSETASTVQALGPERIEALSHDGGLLRAVVVADLIKKETHAAAQTAATHTAMQTSDPETQRMIVFAELLERAHGRATDAIRETAGQAFAQMQEISNNLAQQATASQASAMELSMAIRNLMLEQARQAVEDANQNPTPEPGPLEKFASNFLGGAEFRQAEHAASSTPAPAAAPNGKSNGHSKRAKPS
jgi:hypothetical protein